MDQISNEEEKFANNQEAEKKFASTVPLTIRNEGKCAYWIPILLCIFLISFSGYKLYTSSMSDADGHCAPLSSLTTVIDETRATLEAIRQANAVTCAKNREIANEYLDNVQTALQKRVESRIKQISVLITEKVQDIEAQLSVFEKSISSTVDGNLDFTKDLIEQIKSTVNAVSSANATSTLEDAIKRIEDEVTKFTVDLDQMYSFYGRYINDILYHETENITARIRMILVKDRKMGQNLIPQPRAALCYKISRQNHELSSYLQKVLDASNRLEKINNTMNVFSSALLDIGHSANGIVDASNAALRVLVNDTKLIYDTLVNTDINFLGTVLKTVAYNQHLKMRLFIYHGYETVIRSLVPALEKVSRDFSVVKDSHWKRITAVLNREIADVSELIRSKVSLITDVSRRVDVAQKSKFKSVYAMLANKFKNASSTVNQLFETKQTQMIEGLTLSLDFNLFEQLPLVSTRSLLDYLPVETCPMSIDFQTFLKSTMDGQLHQNSDTASVTLQQVLEVDAEFDSAKRDAKGELEFSTDEFNSISSSARRDSKQKSEVEKIRSSEDDQSITLLSA